LEVEIDRKSRGRVRVGVGGRENETETDERRLLGETKKLDSLLSPDSSSTYISLLGEC
jgi:hypothetical protein